MLTHVVRKLFAAEKMEMQVLHRLTSVLAAIGDDTVTVGKPLGSRDFRNRFKNCGNVGTVLCIDSVSGRDMLLRDDQNVYGCHWVDIAECINLFILVYFSGGDLSRYNFTKNTI